MTRKRPRQDPRPAAPARHQEETEEEPAPPDEAELTRLALDRLAKSTHPELFLALQEQLPETDTRWLNIFAYAFDDQGTMSPLLQLQPVNLNPLTFDLGGGERGGSKWIVERLVELFATHPWRLSAWQARVSFHVVQALGEARCMALGREGMGEVVGAVEEKLMRAEFRVPARGSLEPFELDASVIPGLVDADFPSSLARARLGTQLQRQFPNEDDEHLDTMVTEAVKGLQFQVGVAPEFAVEARVVDKPWVPLSSVMDVLKRRLMGGLRVLKTL